ncbi:MAG: hypothetical protein AAFX99_20800 [Myxococcota bacterium]
MGLTLCSSGVWAQSNATPSAHWGSYLTPSSTLEARFQFHTLLLSQFGQQPPSQPTRRWTTTLAEDYGTLERTYGMNIASATVTSNVPLENDLFDPRFFYTLGLSAGWFGDGWTSFAQNQILHNTFGMDAVAREGGNPHDPFLGFSAEFNSFHGSPATARANSEGPAFVGFGLNWNSLLWDSYLHVGLSDFNPISGTFEREFSWPRWIPDLYLFGTLRAGYAFQNIPQRIDWLREPLMLIDDGLERSDLKESYVMSQVGFTLDLLPWSNTTFLLRFSFTGTTGIFAAEDADNRADNEQSIPENFISIYGQIGDLWIEVPNDLQGDKDRGPSYGLFAGYRWEL